MLARLRQALRGLWTAMIAGGLFALPIGRLADRQPANLSAQILQLFLFGALCGLVILGAIRLFRTARWGYLIAGPLAGALPVVVMAPVKMSRDDFGGLWMLCSILGLLIALLEWQRVSADTKKSCASDAVES